MICYIKISSKASKQCHYGYDEGDGGDASDEQQHKLECDSLARAFLLLHGDVDGRGDAREEEEQCLAGLSHLGHDVLELPVVVNDETQYADYEEDEGQQQRRVVVGLGDVADVVISVVDVQLVLLHLPVEGVVVGVDGWYRDDGEEHQRHHQVVDAKLLVALFRSFSVECVQHAPPEDLQEEERRSQDELSPEHVLRMLEGRLGVRLRFSLQHVHLHEREAQTVQYTGVVVHQPSEGDILGEATVHIKDLLLRGVVVWFYVSVLARLLEEDDDEDSDEHYPLHRESDDQPPLDFEEVLKVRVLLNDVQGHHTSCEETEPGAQKAEVRHVALIAHYLVKRSIQERSSQDYRVQELNQQVEDSQDIDTHVRVQEHRRQTRVILTSTNDTPC